MSKDKFFFILLIVAFSLSLSAWWYPLKTPPPLSRFINKYAFGDFNGSLYTLNSNSSANYANSLFQVISDTRGTPQFQVQNGGPEQASFIARSFLVVNQNNTLLNSSQNNICGDWGFTQIDCNTSTTGADFGVTDDIEALGLMYTKGGFRSYVDKQSAFFVASENISKKYSGNNGSYRTDTKYFCDYTSDNFDNTGGWINIIEEASGYEGAWGDINSYINTSCISLKNVPGWKTNITNISWRVVNSPDFILLKGGFGEYYIGNDVDSGFKFKIKNGTSTRSVVIDDKVGARNHRAFLIEQDMNGFSTVGQTIHMYSSKQLVDKELIMLQMIGGIGNMNSSDGVFIDMSFLGEPLSAFGDGHIDGIHMPSGLEHLIEVGSADTLDVAYYEATNITSQVSTTVSTVQVFINDNDLIYIGNSFNFTTIGITLSTPSSTNIVPLYYYCDNTGNWKPLIGVISSTGGFITPGTITFPNPVDRGKCNKELDGTPFSDINTYTYIAIQRTRNFIVTPPTLDLIRISGASTNMFLKEDMLRLSPVDTAPETCTVTNLGAIYFDISEDDMCVCKAVGWRVMFDGTACT